MSTKCPLTACLDAIDSCQVFIGILGERVGYIPKVSPQLCSRLGFETHDNQSITEIEMRYAMTRAENNLLTPFFYIRNSGDLSLMVPAELRPTIFSPDVDQVQWKKLKSDLLQTPHEVFNGYPATFEGLTTPRGKPLIQGLDDFGNRVLENLWNSAKTSAALEGQERLRCSRLEAQLSFISSRAGDFVGREKLVTELGRCINAGQELVISVESLKPGTGVTSAICKACKSVPKKWKVIPYFHEAPGSCSNLKELLRYLYVEVCRAVGVKIDRPMGATEEFYAKSLSNILHDPETPICLILDDLDQISDGEKLLQCLPSTKTKNFKLVISVSGGARKLSMALGRLKPRLFQVGNLDYQDKTLLARLFLARHGKTLEDSGMNNQLAKLTGKREASNVGYLSLLCQEIASYGVFENLESHLASLGDTCEGLLNQLVDKVDCSEESVGQVVMAIYCGQRAVTYCGLNGALSAQDLLNSSKCLSKEPLSAMEVSLIITGLEVFLQRTEGSLLEGRLLIKSGLPFAVLDKRFGLSSSRQIDLARRHSQHVAISTSLRQQYSHALATDPSKPIDPKVTKCLPYHLWQAGDMGSLEKVICDLAFVQHSSSDLSLLQFYLSLLPSADKKQGGNSKSYVRFLEKNADIISCEPGLTVQQALQDREMRGQVDNPQCAFLPSPKVIMTTEIPSREEPLIISRSLNVPSQMTSATVETARRELDVSKRLAAFGFANGSILVCLANTTSTLFMLNGLGSAVTAMAFYQVWSLTQFNSFSSLKSLQKCFFFFTNVQSLICPFYKSMIFYK